MKGHRSLPMPSNGGEPTDKIIGPLQGRALDKIEEAHALVAEAAGLLRAALNVHESVWQSNRWKATTDVTIVLAEALTADLSKLAAKIVELPPEDGGPYGVFGGGGAP